jgi:hypothetical protein
MPSFNQSIKSLKGNLFSSHQNPILHNRWVLYVIFFISLANLFYLSVERDFTTISIFILVGFLTSFFSKNMLIILFFGLVSANILKYGSGIVKEGFEESDEDTNQQRKKNPLSETPDKEVNMNKDQTPEYTNEFEEVAPKKKKTKSSISSSIKPKIDGSAPRKVASASSTQQEEDVLKKLSENTEILKDKIGGLIDKMNVF